MRFLVGGLCLIAALLWPHAFAGAQDVEQTVTGETVEETMSETVMPETTLEQPTNTDAATASPRTTADLVDDESDLRRARNRVIYASSAIGLGAAGLVMSIFAGSDACQTRIADGSDRLRCNSNRTIGIVFSSTVMAGGAIGMIPAARSFAEKKKEEKSDQRARWDLLSSRLVF